MPGVSPISDGSLPALANDAASAPGAVRVNPGDTWQIFADENGVDVKDLMSQNHIDPKTDPGQPIPFEAVTLPKRSHAETPSPEPSPAHAQTSKSALPSAPGDPEAASAMKASLKARAQSRGTPVAGTTPGGAAAAGVTAIHSVARGGEQGVKVVSPVYKLANHDFVVVETSAGRQAFYRSSGINSGNPEKWYPFDEVLPGGHLRKEAYKAEGRLNRLGSDEAARISDQLGKMEIPEGAEVPEGLAGDTAETTANRLLDFFRARSGAPTVMRPVPDDLAAEEAAAAGQGVAEEGAGAATKAAVEAGEEGAVKLGAAGAAMEALGFVGFMLEPLQMMGSYFGTFEEVKNAVKSRGYTDGFSEGVAAAMKGVPQDEVRGRFGREVANDSVGTKVGGAEGVEDRYHNKGLVDGYKYFKSLPPEKQQKLRDAAKANGWNLEKDEVTDLERGVRPVVVDMFQKAAEAQEKAEEEKVRKMMGWQ